MRQRIGEATDRMLAGNPRTVEVNRLTAVALAKEAGVGRATLYRAPYDDLRTRFEERVRFAQAVANQDVEPEDEHGPLNPLRRLEANLARATEELQVLKECVAQKDAAIENLGQQLAFTRARWRDAVAREAVVRDREPQSDVIPLQRSRRRRLNANGVENESS